jgi:hypothetical protein
MRELSASMRDGEEGDEAGIARLYGEVFSGGFSPGRWRWQYWDNIQGRAWVGLGESVGEIVAHYALMRRHLNHMGREVVAATPTDTMVRSDQRGQGWYTRLAERVYAQAQAAGARALFGFPNRESFPGFVRNLRGHKITGLKTYYYRTGFRKHLGAAAGAAARFFAAWPNRSTVAFMARHLFPRHEVRVAATLAPELERPLREMLGQEVLGIWKDLAYMRYRYQEHPDRAYRFHTLYADGSPQGLVVVRDANGLAMICEVLHRKKNVRETAFLLRSVLSHCQRRSSVDLVEFRGWDGGFFDAAFALAGFKCLPTSELVFAGRVFDDPELEKKFLLPHNWTVAIGDTDIV